MITAEVKTTANHTCSSLHFSRYEHVIKGKETAAIGVTMRPAALVIPLNARSGVVVLPLKRAKCTQAQKPSCSQKCLTVKQGVCIQKYQDCEPALMAATDQSALWPAQISKKYLEGARAQVIAAEGFVSALDCGDVGPDFLSNEIVGSVR